MSNHTTKPIRDNHPPMHTRAVEHYQQTGTSLPGSQGEIAAYLADKNGEQDG